MKTMNSNGLNDMIGYMMSVGNDLGEFKDLTIAVVIDDHKLRIRQNHNGLTMTLKQVREEKWVEPDEY